MKLLTTREAAKRLGVGTTTIKRWSDEGLLSCAKTIGGHRRYRESDILALKQTNQTMSIPASLPTLSCEQLDALPLGVIQLADDGRVVQYNATEQRFSGYSRKDVVGKNFFGEIAPCTNNTLVYGHFKRGVANGEMDTRLMYTFSYRMELVNVTLHLYRDRDSGTNWLLIDAGNQMAKLRSKSK